MWELKFISEQDFKAHVQETIQKYGEQLDPYNLKKFNSNIIDPIKLIFDKTVYKYTWEEIIKNEIYRQKDKSNNNSIGYFYQNIFKYIKGCTVPKEGWDVIYSKDGGIDIPKVGKFKTIYVEMKTKHNTMNSSSSSRTYIKMLSKLLKDNECCCFWVEAIAKTSQNIKWETNIDKERSSDQRLRRVSIDKFFEIVTGQSDAFYQICMVLPEVIQEIVNKSNLIKTNDDTVYEELQELAKRKQGSFILALYMLGFESYIGF